MEDVYSLVADSHRRGGFHQQGQLALRLKQWFTKSQLLEIMDTLGLSDSLNDRKSKGELFVDIAGVLLHQHDGQSTEEEEGEEEEGEEEEGEEEEGEEEEGEEEETFKANARGIT